MSSRGHALPGLPTSVSCSYRTNYVVTNNITQDSTEATYKACGFRWKIEREGRWDFPSLSNHAVEQLHREGKQLTGWEKCQCRQARIQRNAARTRRPP